MDELQLGSVLTNCQIDAATDRNNLIILDRNKCGDPQYLSNMMKRHGTELHPSFYGSSHVTPTPPKSRSTSMQRRSRKRRRHEFEYGNNEVVNQQLDDQHVQSQQQSFDFEFDVPAVDDAENDAAQSDETPQEIDDAMDTDNDDDEFRDIDDNQNKIGISHVEASNIQADGSLPPTVPVAQHLPRPPPLPRPFREAIEETEERRNDDDDQIIAEPPKKKARRTAEYIFKNNSNEQSKRSWWLCTKLSLRDYDS